ncbi:hypothetical protein C1M55_15910 [Rhodococcus qingshengii]|nr:hypothetical protein C1M55_15910 [Rhodococcus qingshengii]QEM27073.1 hypothetical protein D6M20_09985 [Rhodococcus qingshengii]
MSIGRSGSDSDSLMFQWYQYLSTTETQDFPNNVRPDSLATTVVAFAEKLTTYTTSHSKLRRSISVASA